MSYRPITYCSECSEPFDVYHAPDDRVCDCCKELGAIHASDCAVHNAPALPVGPCDCGVDASPTVDGEQGNE